VTLYELIQAVSPVSFDELLYQVGKHDIDLQADQVLDALRFLEGQGLVKCELRITDLKKVAGCK
jgi:Fe2+ or Zn2+ uptake regulation protein